MTTAMRSKFWILDDEWVNLYLSHGICFCFYFYFGGLSLRKTLSGICFGSSTKNRKVRQKTFSPMISPDAVQCSPGSSDTGRTPWTGSSRSFCLHWRRLNKRDDELSPDYSHPDTHCLGDIWCRVSRHTSRTRSSFWILQSRRWTNLPDTDFS